MPCNYSRYPPNWKTEIRPRILKRAGDKCEKCGAKNHEVYIRGWHNGTPYFQGDDGGEYWNADTGERMGEDYACFSSGKVWLVRIILTIAHMENPDPMDCRDENLKALCQRCHLIQDKDHHRENRRVTMQKRKNQLPLF